jgi:predicted TIM-barrel fold metal-dependent hydrolase
MPGSNASSSAEYDIMASDAGLERIVFVQPSPYGSDNSCMLDALGAVGARGRGVAVIDDKTSDADLDHMHEAGVRGIRLNAESYGLNDPAAIGGTLKAMARRVGRLGWHIQLFASLDTIAGLAPVIRSLDVPLVIDHMGMARAERGTDYGEFETLLRLIESGVWIKLSAPYRVSEAGPDFPDVRQIASALIGANANRVIWGSDWPHTGKHTGGSSDSNTVLAHRSVDDARVIRLLADWAGSRDHLHNILVHNPRSLYDF